MDSLSNNDNNKENNYVLTIDNFEGPLDLLWDLIKRAKIDVTEIYISQITEQYILYLKLMEKMNVKIASEFIVMASDLLYYKSKALIPGEELEDEYFIPPLPPDLVERLIEYKKIQLTSQKLKDYYDNQADTFYRQNPEQEVIDEDYIGITLFDLLDAFTKILTDKVQVEQEEIVFDEILVGDRITYIADILKDKDHIRFVDLFPERPSRALLIVTFMAILEMAKHGQLKIMQHRVFGDIRILRN
ncbi:MAG: segregation/condensation protein A [Spirochaetes bacterium]|nr:segregation/condensation protein A [Spirochaetota bacterium]